MALSSQDLVKGLDFTGFVSATAADHNALVDSATLKIDTAGAEGKSINLWTVDSALNTPIVPNAAVTTKWKKYKWVRYPHSTATSTKPIEYAWDDNAVSVATYLQWKETGADLTAVLADVATLQGEMVTAQADIITASNAAAAASIIANTASNNAITALADAATADANATTALTNANAAQVDADAAQATADAALSAATAAQNTATNANTAATANRNVRYVKIVERQAKGVGNGQSVANLNTRQFNYEESDAGGLASIAAGVITLAAGTYQVMIHVPCYNITAHQAFLVKDSDASIYLTGTSSYIVTDEVTGISYISGILTLAAATAIRVDDWCTGGDASGLASGLGAPANISPSGATYEIYAVAEFIKLD